MAWFAGAAAIGCLVVGLLHLYRLVTVPVGRVGEASSAAAAIGMAAMFSPLGDPVPAPVWIAVFGACAVWAAVLAVGARTIDRAGVHHLLCSAAMLFMLLGHGLHGGRLGPVSVVALVAAGYFAWHGLGCVDHYRAGRSSAVAGVRIASTIAMSGMLVAMI